MNPVVDYTEVIRCLTAHFNLGRDRIGTSVRMIGLTFARPNAPLAKEEIIPQLNDWHYRSGPHILFLFAGYMGMERWEDPPAGYIQVPIPGRDPWLYSSERFDAFRREIEARTSWHYAHLRP